MISIGLRRSSYVYGTFFLYGDLGFSLTELESRTNLKLVFSPYLRLVTSKIDGSEQIRAYSNINNRLDKYLTLFDSAQIISSQNLKLYPQHILNFDVYFNEENT